MCLFPTINSGKSKKMQNLWQANSLNIRQKLFESMHSTILFYTMKHGWSDMFIFEVHITIFSIF